MIIGNSFLTTAGIPIAEEKDLKNCVAMMIMDRLRAGSSFCEFHPVDFNEDFVLVGHITNKIMNLARRPEVECVVVTE